MNKNSSRTQNTYSNSPIHAHERSLGEVNFCLRDTCIVIKRLFHTGTSTINFNNLRHYK